MKRTIPILLLVLLGLASPELQAQRKADLGFRVAVPWYQGDLASIVPQPYVTPPALGPIFRYNFNMRNSLRGFGTYYTIGGEGQVFGGDVAEFQASFVDLGLEFEFNWWPYKTAWRKTKLSPYVSAGLGYSININGSSTAMATGYAGQVSHFFIPFGGGLKANLGKRMSGGVEVTMRKTFTDILDGVVNVGTDGTGSPVGNNDWYFFTGVFISYKIFEYRDACPAMEGATRINKGSVAPGETKSKRK